MLVSTYRAVDIWRWDIIKSNYELELIIYWIVRWNQFALIRLQSNYVQKNEDILRSLDTLDSIGLAFFYAGFLRECYISHFSTLLMYAMTITRLDLRYALFVLSRYCANSDVTHIKATTRVLRYVKETLSYEIHYEETTRFVNYIDANWADAKDDRRFIEDWLFFMSKDFISWSFKRQNLVTQSSCESKYVALSEAEKKAIWLRSLLLQLHAIFKIFIVIWIDN